jgi:hypothetical protein
MNDISKLTFTCTKCGYEWKARTANPKFPTCSKCKSREVQRSGPEPPLDEEVEASTPSPPKVSAEDLDFRLNNLILDFKSLLFHLSGYDPIDDEAFYISTLTWCPYCGATNDRGMHRATGCLLMCRTCGRKVG